MINMAAITPAHFSRLQHDVIFMMLQMLIAVEEISPLFIIKDVVAWHSLQTWCSKGKSTQMDGTISLWTAVVLQAGL